MHLDAPALQQHACCLVPTSNSLLGKECSACGCRIGSRIRQILDGKGNAIQDRFGLPRLPPACRCLSLRSDLIGGPADKPLARWFVVICSLNKLYDPSCDFRWRAGTYNNKGIRLQFNSNGCTTLTSTPYPNIHLPDLYA